MDKISSVTNILHITDLHFKSDRAHNQKIVLKALLDDIKKESVRVGKPDLIVFSGDLVYSADDESVYDKLYDTFVEELLQVTNCDHSRFYIVPGNHDLERRQVEESRIVHDQLLKKCIDRDSLNECYLNGEISEFAGKTAKKYFEFQNFFDAEGMVFENKIVQVYDLPEKNICIVCFNTAWMGVAGVDNVGDLRKLLLPEAALVDAIEKVPSGRFVVGVHHHPTNWLSEFSEKDFKDYLGGKINLQLVGHVHDPRPIVFRDANGETFQNQAGALYTWRDDRYLGYSFVRVASNQGHIEVCWRSYYDKRRCFDEATNINDNSGWLYSSENSKDFFASLFDARKRDDAIRWVCTSVKAHYSSEFEQGLLDRPTSDVFVAPPLHKHIFVPSKKEEESDKFTYEEMTFSEFRVSTENIILQAYPEYGRTTLLQQLCIERCRTEEMNGSEHHFIPVLLNFGDFVPGTKRIEKAIRDRLPNLPSNCNVEMLLQMGAFVLCVDDVVFSDPKGLSELRTFISTYKGNRFILSTQMLRKFDGMRHDAGLPIHFEYVTMAQFRRKDIRILVQKWEGKSATEEELIEKIVGELRAINVPQTPINSSLLLDIISNDQSFSPLNRPSLIERFIETLLKKRSLAEIERKKFDFRNHVHYLGYISEYMCREDRYVLPFEELFEITGKYLKGLGLSFSVRDIIDNSIESRILLDRRSKNTVSFRFRAFLEFFVASQMRSDLKFKEWILEEERFLSYLNEIEYYAGLERQDVDLLRLVSVRHEKYTSEIFGDSFATLLDNDKLIPKSYEENLRYSDDLAEKIREDPLTTLERDEVLDTEIPVDAEGRQEVFRPAPKDAPARYILSLVMYTTLVKNTELIFDVDKREHLSKVLRSWAYIILGSFLAIPSLVKNRRLTVNGLDYVISYPKEYSDDRVAKLISVNIPKEVGRLLYLHIGTEKLEVQLSQARLDEKNKPKLIEYFQNSLYIDLRLKEWWKVPGAFNRNSKDSQYFQEVMLAKVVDIYGLGAFSKSVEKELQNEIVDSFARIYAPDASKMEKLRNKKKMSMERIKNLNALRAGIDKKKH